MIVSTSTPIRSYLDPKALDVLDVQVGSTSVLVWKQVVSKDILEVKNRLAWYESTLVTCLWVTAIFAMMGLLSYYFTKIDELDGQCVKGVVET